MSKPVVKWTDKGWGAIYRKMTQGRPGTHVRIGVVGSAASQTHTDTDLTIAEVATINEFGLGVPERSFLRSTTRKRVFQQQLKYMMAQASRKVLFQGFTRAGSLVSVAEWAVQQVKETILDNVPPPQATETILKKGHDLTLRETYTLFNSIGWEFAVGGDFIDEAGGDE